MGIGGGPPRRNRATDNAWGVTSTYIVSAGRQESV
jgi:hypothetical protein